MAFTLITRRLALIAATVLALAGPAVAEPVVMATEASFPPFSRTEADGSFSGFEIDLGNAVCERAGFDCTWVKQDFDGAIAALLAEKFDIIFSSMSIKPERQRVADFSIPYYSVASAVFAAKGALKNVPADLGGRKLGVYGGSTQDQYARANFADVDIRPYENIDQMSADLVAGRIDAMFVESLPGQEFLARPEGAPYELAGDLFQDEALGAGAGAMLRKGDARKARVDAALKAIYADGTFDELQKKWFVEGTDVKADHLW